MSSAGASSKYAEAIRDLAGGRAGRALKGLCHELASQLQEIHPELRLERGHYFCPARAGGQPHWWCRAPDGTVIDPTADQFASAGTGAYVALDAQAPEPRGRCLYCGELVYLRADSLCDSSCAEAFGRTLTGRGTA